MPSLRLALKTVVLLALQGFAQSRGRLSGRVVLEETGAPMHGVRVLIVELGGSTLSEDEIRSDRQTTPMDRTVEAKESCVG